MHNASSGSENTSKVVEKRMFCNEVCKEEIKYTKKYHPTFTATTIHG